MKTIKTILIVNFIAMLMALAITASAQTFTPSSVKASTSTSVVGDITIAGKVFKGGESRTGSIYIMRVSKKSGKTYKSYIGTPLKNKNYEGQQVYWANKKGQKVYFYFTISDTTGYPKRNYLDAN